MNMTVTEQMRQLFLSCGMGFLLGAYYDFFRVPRLIMRSDHRTIFIQDLLFFLSAAVITFLFSLAVMDGRLRFYLFLGEAIGFAAYYFTIGRLVMRFAWTITAAVLFVWKILWQVIFAPFRLLFRLFRRPCRWIFGFLKKTVQFGVSILKKGLKRARTVLYNQKKASGTTSGTSPFVLHKRRKNNHEGRQKE